MVNRSFYNLVNDNYSKGTLEKLSFKMDFRGPPYRITFGEKYKKPLDAIENNDFRLEITTPIVKEITDKDVKKNVLLRLINHGEHI